jgi:hypothetical protein
MTEDKSETLEARVRSLVRWVYLMLIVALASLTVALVALLRPVAHTDELRAVSGAKGVRRGRRVGTVSGVSAVGKTCAIRGS